MSLTFLCYAKCTTCQKAKRWLDEKGYTYNERPIKEAAPTYEELGLWQKKSGLPLKSFFNTSGLIYRDLELSKKLPSLSEDEMLRLLASDGMLVKRPVLIGEDFVLVGFQPDKWLALLEANC